MGTTSFLQAALRYAELGYLVFPCVPGGKAPATAHGYLDATTDLRQIEAWWTARPLANIGMPTTGLWVVDVDGPDNQWPSDLSLELMLADAPMSLTPHGGRHYFFRQPEGQAWRSTTGKIAPKVDTRANGGYVLLPPSVVDEVEYVWANPDGLGAPSDLPVAADQPASVPELSSAELGAPQVSPGANTTAQGAPHGTHGAPLVLDGNPIPAGHRNATLARLAGAMRRVGMTQAEIRVGLITANQRRCQPPLDDREVERIAASIARYEPDTVAVAVAENHWGQDNPATNGVGESDPEILDPGPFPRQFLRVPGFIAEVMDYCLETAPYPNSAMAFAGALVLQATLAARKVRDPGDNRTNVYILGLANSSGGKERPRKVNAEILHAVGLADQIGGRFASGEGLQDGLFVNPTMLFQTDEIDGILQSINKSRDVRYESIMETLLTMYSSANSIFPMRRKAGRTAPGTIDQPCLVVFGTAVPRHFYQALSERMLTNGFFGRMIVLECGNRSTGREPKILPLPERVLALAQWWANFRIGTGNFDSWHPVPQIIPHTAAAKRILVDTMVEADDEYDKAEAVDDVVATTVWGRVSEHARKLALIYAVSENHLRPEIGKAAATWASHFILHQTRRMLFMARNHVADSPFDGECLRFLRKLRAAPDHELPHSVLLKRMKVDAKSFSWLVTTLEQRGDIVVQVQATGGRTGRVYRLPGSPSVPAGEDG